MTEAPPSADAPLPFPGASRETRIRRDARGRWFDGDEPIDHPGLARNFDRWVDRADDGRYCLRNEVNWAYVSIEGPPVFVRRVAVEPPFLRLFLSDDREERLDPDTLRQGPDGALYCDVRGGRLPARFDRGAMQALEDHLVETGDGGVALRLGDELTVTPAQVREPLASPAGGH
ncbi:MAG TPA: DUF1285 domain-containing protein [Polyangiaceae bacterium LLY-WYZ-14_1]|jgi:hypothetical protein|nr:DUF1285 domain-containing protein [Polyangiaceae bacterium LLY-WYZ-14_1]